MSNVIDLAARRAKSTTLWGLSDALRLELASAMIGFGFDPTNYLDTELGEIMDAIVQATGALRERLAAKVVSGASAQISSPSARGIGSTRMP